MSTEGRAITRETSLPDELEARVYELAQAFEELRIRVSTLEGQGHEHRHERDALQHDFKVGFERIHAKLLELLDEVRRR